MFLSSLNIYDVDDDDDGDDDDDDDDDDDLFSPSLRHLISFRPL